MSEEIIPATAPEVAADVAEKVEAVATPVETAAPAVTENEENNLAEMTLAELSARLEEILADENKMQRAKEVEAVKSAFYRRLSREKAEAGLAPTVDEPSSRDEVPAEEPAAAPAPADNPFAVLEEGFKALYTSYKKERAQYNRELDKEREENLVKKQAVIEDLKALIEKQEDVSATFPAFREIQNRWREIGPVPATAFRNINDTYQFNVERFYDMVKINRDLRDLDFKKNLEVKTAFCEAAEKLAEQEDVVEAFKELQHLHEQWKEYGPVAQEFRESIWDRFKAATAAINKKYQAHFEGQKAQQVENLAAKTALCEEVEAIAEKEITSSNQWNSLSKQIEEIQARWRSIGFATRKDNQKIYERFRAACDKFFERKRVFYADYKDSMNENMARKQAIIERAEELAKSTDWKKTTDELIELQKQWKEIGAVPRKKSEPMWKRFRAACDAFFAERDKNARPAENDYHANLRAKKALIEEINAYEPAADEAANAAAREDFASRFSAIGFVPFKEKEKISEAFRAAMSAKFPDFGRRGPRREGNQRPQRGGQPRPLTEKDKLIQQYRELQQEIVTYENNIGFFGRGKNAEALVAQMQERIDAAKASLKELEGKIRSLEAAEEPAAE